MQKKVIKKILAIEKKLDKIDFQILELWVSVFLNKKVIDRLIKKSEKSKIK